MGKTHHTFDGTYIYLTDPIARKRLDILVASLIPVLLIVIVAVVVICVQRRRNRRKHKPTRTPEPDGGMIVLPDVKPQRLSVARMDKRNYLGPVPAGNDYYVISWTSAVDKL